MAEPSLTEIMVCRDLAQKAAKLDSTVGNYFRGGFKAAEDEGFVGDTPLRGFFVQIYLIHLPSPIWTDNKGFIVSVSTADKEDV